MSTMGKITIAAASAAMLAGFVSAIPLSVDGSTNVFDDAVFWFRGGKDISGDHCMQQGEFFDDLQANNNNHANHKMSMSNFTGDYKSFKENAAFQNEPVVFPALGTNVVKDMQVLRISNAGKKLSCRQETVRHDVLLSARHQSSQCLCKQQHIQRIYGRQQDKNG